MAFWSKKKGNKLFSNTFDVPDFKSLDELHKFADGIFEAENAELRLQNGRLKRQTLLSQPPVVPKSDEYINYNDRFNELMANFKDDRDYEV